MTGKEKNCKIYRPHYLIIVLNKTEPTSIVNMICAFGKNGILNGCGSLNEIAFLLLLPEEMGNPLQMEFFLPKIAFLNYSQQHLDYSIIKMQIINKENNKITKKKGGNKAARFGFLAISNRGEISRANADFF